MEERAQSEVGAKRHSLGSILPWVLIAILVIATVGWMVWAAHQPEVRSSWNLD
jgi:Na+/melibiose symporter-like transporter